MNGRSFHRLVLSLSIAAVSIGSFSCSGGGPTSPDVAASGGQGVSSAPGAGITVILGFGDSITHGRDGDIPYTDSAIGGYIPTLQELLDGDGHRVTIVNDGVSGSSSGNGVERIDRSLRRIKPDIVLILYGTNDEYEQVPRSLHKEVVIRNLATIVVKCKDAGARPVLATIPPCCGSHADLDDGLEELSRMIQELARSERVPLADIRRAFVTRGRCDLIGDTGNHPTDDGYRLIAEVFRGVLRSML